MSRAVEIYMSRVMLLLENRNLRNQLMKFVVTGFCGLFSDVSVYRMMVKIGAHVTPAKALGCCMGTVVVFFINRAWTFSVQQRSSAQVIRFAALYGTTITLNTTLNTLLLKLVPHPWQLAFVCATAVTTVINFLGSKFIVFKPHALPLVSSERDPDFADGSPDTVVAP